MIAVLIVIVNELINKSVDKRGRGRERERERERIYLPNQLKIA